MSATDSISSVGDPTMSNIIILKNEQSLSQTVTENSELVQQECSLERRAER